MQRSTTHNKKDESSSSTRRSVLKIAGSGILAFVLLIGISSVGATISFSFSDVEASIGNYLRADPLNFTVSLATRSVEVGAGEQLLVPVMTPASDSELIQYFVKAKVLDDGGLCPALRVLTTAPFPYDGSLMELSTATTTEVGPWALTVSLAQDATPPADSFCQLQLVYTGWNADAMFGQGYSITERVPLLFYLATSSAPLLNIGEVEGTSTEATTTPEVPPLPEAEEHGGGGGGGGAAVIEPSAEAPPVEEATTTPEAPTGDSPAPDPTVEEPPAPAVPPEEQPVNPAPDEAPPAPESPTP